MYIRRLNKMHIKLKKKTEIKASIIILQYGRTWTLLILGVEDIVFWQFRNSFFRNII